MNSKKFLAFLMMWSWLWLSGVVVPVATNGTVPDKPAPGVENRLQQPPSVGTQAQPGNVPDETNRRQPFVNSPNNDTEHNQQFCESPQMIEARCEPIPGSPLSASPLV